MRSLAHILAPPDMVAEDAPAIMEKILTCAQHDFITSEPRRMRAHMLTSHPGVLEDTLKGEKIVRREIAGGDIYEWEEPPTPSQLNSIHDMMKLSTPPDAGVREKGAARQPSKIKEGPVDQVKIDLSSRQAWRGDQEVTLTRSEFEILAEMAKFPTVAISRAQLLRAMGWKGDGFETRTVDAHIYRLRQKLGPICVPIPSFGYRLEASVEIVERMRYQPKAEAQSLLVCPNCNTPLKGYIDLLRAD